MTGAGPIVDDDWQSVAQRLLLGRWRILVVFCGLATVYLASSAPAMINDTRAAASAAWLLATTGSLDFRAAGFSEIWHQVAGVDGVYTDRFPGTFLVAVPFYWLAPTARPDDLLGIPMAPAGVAAALLVALAVVVLVEVLRELVDPWTALGSGLVAGLATPVWSVAGRALWTHTVAVAALSLVLLAAVRDRWWLVGVAFGFLVFSRPTHAVTAAVFGLVVAWSRRSWRVGTAVAVPSLAGLAALSAYSQAVFGTWLPIAGYNPERVAAIVGARAAMLGEFTWVEQVVGTLVDRHHGVIPFSLFLVPLVLAAPAGWRRAPDWARAALVAGGAFWLAQLRGNRFTGGFDFVGYRFPIDPLWLMVPVLVLGWVAWRERFPAWRRVTLATVAISVGWMIALVLVTPQGVLVEPDRPGRGTAQDGLTDLPRSVTEP